MTTISQFYKDAMLGIASLGYKSRVQRRRLKPVLPSLMLGHSRSLEILAGTSVMKSTD
jgi:hypothetical protein